jgi:hypothetical protein
MEPALTNPPGSQEIQSPPVPKKTGGRRVFVLYAALLGVILAVPWSGWLGGGPLKFFRDYVDWSDWRGSVPFAAILLGMVASIAGLVRGRFWPAVPAVVGGALFLGVGSMSFGAFPSLIGIGDGGEGKACAILLCVLAAGAKCARRRRGAKLPLRIAGVAGIVLLLVGGASLLFTCLHGDSACQQAYARVFLVPPAFNLWGFTISHACAVVVSGVLVLAAVGSAAAALHTRGASRFWPALAEAAAKCTLLVSPLYALARDGAAGGSPDFANYLRFRWELTSAIFLLLVIDGLAEVMISLTAGSADPHFAPVTRV